jgi:hypothetical protein
VARLKLDIIRPLVGVAFFGALKEICQTSGFALVITHKWWRCIPLCPLAGEGGPRRGRGEGFYAVDKPSLPQAGREEPSPCMHLWVMTRALPGVTSFNNNIDNINNIINISYYRIA